ncbi:MAG TPA: transketolase [Phycisphaerae bacterium]|nr:transketolase [Phycisphaerae bacterium]
MIDYQSMRRDCLRIRNRIVDAIHRAGSGHSGGSLSCVEILWTLYSAVLRHRPREPRWADRDRFLLSKGHAAPALYAVLAEKGFFDPGELATLRQAGSRLQGHPDMTKVPGVEMSTGSLGMGISAGVGMALGARLAGKDSRVYVLVGDGELDEGQNWEAMMSAAKFALDNLTVVVDRNGVQLDGTVDEVMPLGDLAGKLARFGLAVHECDGHDCRSIHEALLHAAGERGRPQAVVARTVKGKGVSFMEGQSAWHGKPISDEDYRIAKRELAGAEGGAK